MKNCIGILLTILFSSCNSEKKHFITDKDIIILEEKISKDKTHKIISYHYDLGAFDYSRIFWVIIPSNLAKSEPLNDYLIPDGYKAIDWNENDMAMLEKWEPYYYKDEEVQLESGDKLNGVIIEVKK